MPALFFFNPDASILPILADAAVDSFYAALQLNETDALKDKYLMKRVSCSANGCSNNAAAQSGHWPALGSIAEQWSSHK